MNTTQSVGQSVGMHFNRAKLREWLREQERSCRWLARHSGVHEQTIYKLVKRDDYSPDLGTVSSVARVMKCHPYDLLVVEPSLAAQ